MKLANPFSLEVRLLYIDCWTCWLCSENGQRNGGLEIHHVMGRISDSAFNSSCLCKRCHEHMGHNEEEERTLFFKTLKFLHSIEYQPIAKDYEFFKDNYKRLMTAEIETWLHQTR